ncbi:MAG TPA: porin family protein [Bacteroidales bacterium]|nr:porin family protein [Bacteroidales bacterium]
MKSRIFLAITAILVFAAASEADGQLYYGIRAGGTLSTQSETGILWTNDGLRQGFNLGVFGGYRLNEHFSVQTGAKFEEKGMRYNYINNEGTFRVLRKNDYINIPFLLKGTLGEKSGLPESWSIYGFAGPYAAVQVYEKEKFISGHPQDATNLTDSSKSPDFGAVAGAGISKKIRNGHEIFFELSYEMGLVKIDSNNPDYRNKASEASFGFRF